MNPPTEDDPVIACSAIVLCPADELLLQRIVSGASSLHCQPLRPGWRRPGRRSPSWYRTHPVPYWPPTHRQRSGLENAHTTRFLCTSCLAVFAWPGPRRTHFLPGRGGPDRGAPPWCERFLPRRRENQPHGRKTSWVGARSDRFRCVTAD